MKQEVGRLAFRIEGDWWVAYYALPASMKDVIELSRIRMTCVERHDRKQAFMNLMRDTIADVLENQIGHRPDWNAPTKAPEHERAGRA